MLCLSAAAFRSWSPTQDEVAHLPAGLSYWRTRDLRLNLEHPVLVKMLAALPLVVMRAPEDFNVPAWKRAPVDTFWAQWRFGESTIDHWSRRDQYYFWARFMLLLLTLALGVVIYRAGSALGGKWGALLSLSTFATAPFFLAYGPLVVTDVGVALFVLLSVWTFAELWQRPSRRTMIRFAASVTGALLSKFIAGLLLPTFVVLAVWYWWRERYTPAAAKSSLSIMRVRMLHFVAATALTCATVYGVYLVTSWNTPIVRPFSVTSPEGTPVLVPALEPLHRVLEHHHAVAHLVLPVLLYFRGIASIVHTSSRPVFILGRHYTRGQWFYFPLLFLLKMAPGFLLLILLSALLGAFATLRSKTNPTSHSLIIPERYSHHFAALVCTLVVFSAAAIGSHINLGIRHFSVPVTVVTVLIAILPAQIGAIQQRLWRRTLQAVTLAAVVGCAITSVAAFPNYIPYYNFLIGSRPKYAVAGDSNLDWGQSLPALGAFVDNHRIAHVLVDAMGSVNHHLYVPNMTSWKCDASGARSTASGWIAVSAGRLEAFSEGCTWLFAYPHTELAGGSMYVFRLPDAQAINVR